MRLPRCLSLREMADEVVDAAEDVMVESVYEFVPV